MAYRLGVDLGTTFTSAVLLREHAAPEVFALGERSAAVPTVLYIGPDGSVLYGETAEARALTEPGRVVRQFKRRVGDEVPMVVGAGPDELVEHHAHDLAAAMIAWVVASVVAAQGGEAPDAIAVTHPATWGPHKTELLRSALAPHGLADLTLVSEPEAAAYTYAYAGRLAAGDSVAVYDLGGGTFDAAVLHADADGRFAVRGRALGLPDIGGIDFDDAIFAHVLGALSADLRARLGIDDRTGEVTEHGARAVAELRGACTAAKEALSTQTAAVVPVTVDGRTTKIRITRAEFETMIVSLLLPTLSVLDHCAESAEIATSDVTAVLLAGGSSRIPLITQMLSAHLGPDVDVARDIDPKMAVAAGAVLAITAVAPEGHAAAAEAGPAAVRGLARARARADQAAARAAKAPAPVGAVEDAPPVPVAAPPAGNAPKKAGANPVPAQAGPSEPVAIPRGITTDAGKAAYERLAVARAARQAAAADAEDTARAAMNEVDALVAAEDASAAPEKTGPEKTKSKRRRPFAKAEAVAEAAPAEAPPAEAAPLPVAPPPAPSKGDVSFLQPKGKAWKAKQQAKARPETVRPEPGPAPEQPVEGQAAKVEAATRVKAKAAPDVEPAPAPAAEPALPVAIGEVGSGRPIRPHRHGNRAHVVGLERAPGAATRTPRRAAESQPTDKAVVAPRPVGGLADLLGADPNETWAPDAEAARPGRITADAVKAPAIPAPATPDPATPAPAAPAADAQPAVAPERPAVRQVFFADGELVDPEAEEDELGRPRRHAVLVLRRVFSTRRILTVASLTAALFIGSGSAAMSPVNEKIETKAASHVTKKADKR